MRCGGAYGDGFHEADESYDYGEIKGWVERMPVSSAAREAILGGTFQEILAESHPANPWPGDERTITR